MKIVNLKPRHPIARGKPLARQPDGAAGLLRAVGKYLVCPTAQLDRWFTVGMSVGSIGLSILTLGGCHHPRTLQPVSHIPKPIHTPGPGPTYAQLVSRYNANVAGLNRLWSRTDVTMQWISKDEKGEQDYHKESGQGKLIVARDVRQLGLNGPRPGVVITLGALGHTLFWAGSNSRRYWLFDLRGDGKAYVGSFDHGGGPGLRNLPVPIHPSVVPYLLGLMPIDTSRGRGAMREVAGYYEIQPRGTHLKYLLHPRTGLPVRITLTGFTGKPALVAHLNHYQPVQRAGWSKENWPYLATDIKVYPIGREAKLSLALRGMTDGRSEGRINPAVFRFNALRQAHRPARIVNLDEEAGGQ